MPSYTQHILFNFAAALILLFFYQQEPFLTDTQLAFALIGYFIGSCVLNPDLDSPKSKPSQFLIFKPYTMLSRHRGLSHDTLIGTFLRIAYILLLALLIVISYDLITTKNVNINNIESLITLIKEHWEEILSAIGGLFISNLFHILIDKLF